MFTSLNDIDPATQLYFADFGDDCWPLREVIVGPLSRVTEHILQDALGKIEFRRGHQVHASAAGIQQL